MKKLDEKDLADHVDHIRDLVGTDHVGFGFDFCDEMEDFTKAGAGRQYDCIKGYDHCIELSAELLSRGYSEADVVKIIGGNFLRFLEKTIG
jgi:membrane dipeptidase